MLAKSMKKSIFSLRIEGGSVLIVIIRFCFRLLETSLITVVKYTVGRRWVNYEAYFSLLLFIIGKPPFYLK